MGQCHSSHRVKTTTQFDPASDEIPEAAKQEKIRDVCNQLETNGIRILQTEKTDPVLKYWSDTQYEAIRTESAPLFRSPWTRMKAS